MRLRRPQYCPQHLKRATKSANIILLMQRPEGASLEEIVETTG